ncbi:sterol carrier family protein [Actinomadura scrupuli]|uniref:sterol carrier family protein n=1 Tax=Actinomadura scrupuli TaxID=559629 RepID=UPI003D998D5A
MSRSQSRVLTRAALDAQLAELGRPPYAGPETPAALRRGSLDAVLAAYDSGAEPHRVIVKAAVRFLLDVLVAAAPGKSVEVRVPPYAAVQCVEGLRHTRGTPPNVVEMDAPTWLALATGRAKWAEALYDGRIRASGSRADLSAHLPLTLP